MKSFIFRYKPTHAASFLSRPYVTLRNSPQLTGNLCKSGVVVGVVDFRPKCPVTVQICKGMGFGFLGGFRVNLHVVLMSRCPMMS